TNAERESFGLILSLGLKLFGLPPYSQRTMDQPPFLFFAARYSKAKRLRSNGALKHTIEAPATIASQKSPSTNSVRDWTEIFSGPPFSISGLSRSAKSRTTWIDCWSRLSA